MFVILSMILIEYSAIDKVVQLKMFHSRKHFPSEVITD